MKICTFFGHRDAPQYLRVAIKEKITELIEQHGVDLFYAGNHGQFDSMVLSALKELATIYPHIKYYIVLAYYPKGKRFEVNTVLPEGIELCHPRFAIDFRNDWMLNNSEYVITYVKNSWDGAAKYRGKAVKQNKQVFNLE